MPVSRILPAPRLRTLSRAEGVLRSAGIAHALIGGWATRAYGGERPTEDVDLLAADGRVLSDALWAPVRASGMRVDVRVGDDDDPLLGVVRVGTRHALALVDIVVPRGQWCASMLSRALSEGARVSLGGVEVCVVQPADLIVLKLSYSPKDRADIAAILLDDLDGRVRDQVDTRIHDLPAFQQQIWAALKRKLDPP